MYLQGNTIRKTINNRKHNRKSKHKHDFESRNHNNRLTFKMPTHRPQSIKKTPENSEKEKKKRGTDKRKKHRKKGRKKEKKVYSGSPSIAPINHVAQLFLHVQSPKRAGERHARNVIWAEGRSLSPLTHSLSI